MILPLPPTRGSAWGGGGCGGDGGGGSGDDNYGDYDAYRYHCSILILPAHFSILTPRSNGPNTCNDFNTVQNDNNAI